MHHNSQENYKEFAKKKTLNLWNQYQSIMRSKSEQDVYLKFLACAYCACEHFSQLFSWAVLLLQINLFSIMRMIYCILIHFLCLKESLIFFCTLIKILSRVEWFYQTQHSTEGRSSWNFSQSIYETDFDRVFVEGKLRAHLTHFLWLPDAD